MTDLQNIHWATLCSSQCISGRPVIMPSNLYEEKDKLDLKDLMRGLIFTWILKSQSFLLLFIKALRSYELTRSDDAF